MWPRDSVSSERGSLLPLFLGLVAVGLLLSLGAAEVCSGYLFRESVQDAADQVALVAARQKLQTIEQVAPRLVELTNKLTVTQFRVLDGQTAEVRLCGDWNGWLRLPGLDLKKSICAEAAAR